MCVCVSVLASVRVCVSVSECACECVCVLYHCSPDAVIRNATNPANPSHPE